MISLSLNLFLSVCVSLYRARTHSQALQAIKDEIQRDTVYFQIPVCVYVCMQMYMYVHVCVLNVHQYLY